MTQPFHLGLDLDGVVADYTAGFGQFVAEQAGIDVAELPPPTDWTLHKVPGWPIRDSQHYLDLHAGAVANAMFAEMPAIEGASESVQRLRDEGIFIRIITHRLIPGTKPSQVITDTVDWLDHHRIEYDDICFLKDKSALDCNLLIDDSPANIAAYRDAGKLCLIFDQPYNRSVSGWRTYSWAQAEFHILARAGKI